MKRADAAGPCICGTQGSARTIIEAWMSTFADVSCVALDAEWRVRRVAIFFEALFVVALIGLVAIDLVPRRPRLECTTHRAQTMSHYPHPYGEPPPVEWTRCEWR